MPEYVTPVQPADEDRVIELVETILMFESRQPKQYGVTPPITTFPPTEKEIERNQALIEELKKQNSFESPEETHKRYVRCTYRVEI